MLNQKYITLKNFHNATYGSPPGGEPFINLQSIDVYYDCEVILVNTNGWWVYSIVVNSPEITGIPIPSLKQASLLYDFRKIGKF